MACQIKLARTPQNVKEKIQSFIHSYIYSLYSSDVGTWLCLPFLHNIELLIRGDKLPCNHGNYQLDINSVTHLQIPWQSQ